jgi:toxin ParE1/3/4
MSEPIWMRQAEDDLEEIVFKLGRRSRDKALRVHVEIIDRVYGQAQFPLTGRQRDDILPGLRSVAIGDYVAIFRPTDDTIEVLRILHGSRDVERVIREETEL